MTWATAWAKRGGHPKLQTYAKGDQLGRWIVVARAANDKRGNAQWLVTCATCKHRKIFTGTRLRDAPPKRCKGCGLTYEGPRRG